MAQTLVTTAGDKHGPYPDAQLVPTTRGEIQADQVQPGDYLCVGPFCVEIASVEAS